MLRQLKYSRDRSNSWALGYLLNQILITIKTDTDFITPVPLSFERQRQRGFNQVEELLKYYQARLGLVPVRTDIIKKIGHTPPQASLRQLGRQHLRYSKPAYTIEKTITGKNILIVDDVITTGSTANHVAKILIEAGAKRVELCTLLRRM